MRSLAQRAEGTAKGARQSDGLIPKSRKAFFYRAKMRPVRTTFTFCLPGRPKVNTGGACGVLAAGTRAGGIFPLPTASRGQQTCRRSAPRPVSLKRWARSKIRVSAFSAAVQAGRGETVTSSRNEWWRTPRSVVEIAEVQVWPVEGGRPARVGSQRCRHLAARTDRQAEACAGGTSGCACQESQPRDCLYRTPCSARGLARL